MIDLTEKINLWQAMPRNNAMELAAADDYFDKVLMPLAVARFTQIYAKLAKNKYYGMFLTLGTSWQPMALSITALQPQKLWFICTEETRAQLVKLVEFLQLEDNRYGYSIVERSDAEGIYKAMAMVYKGWHQQGECCVDITGGTKAMASCAAMMAAVLKLDTYYVESQYLPLYRRPMPGSEHLELLANPIYEKLFTE